MPNETQPSHSMLEPGIQQLGLGNAVEGVHPGIPPTDLGRQVSPFSISTHKNSPLRLPLIQFIHL